MIIIQNSGWLIRCWDLLPATSGGPSCLILKLRPYCVSHTPLMMLGVNWDSSLGSEQTHFLNNSNYKNILSGTARLREKRQFEQDCNRKNSHRAENTMFVLETRIITCITIIIISHKSSCAQTRQPRMALSNPE